MISFVLVQLLSHSFHYWDLDWSLFLLFVLANDLERIWNKPSLEEREDEEDAIYAEEEWTKEGSCIGDHCLIEMMLLPKSFNLEAMKKTFVKCLAIWISKRCRVRECFCSSLLLCLKSLKYF